MENFDIMEKLGEGSYSTVYKVKRKEDDKIYALKKVKLLNLNEKEKINSLNEVRILASVKSNYVISYKEAFFDEKDSTLGIVMEYADNGDLYQKILEEKKKKKYFEEVEIWKIFIQLVKGLKALHDLQILHRDLKSANVFLFKDGHAKLGDLNVSKVARRGLGYTQTGTPYYASPEIWKDLPYDNKSDIWSLGCVLWEMITLYPPFRAKNMDELYKKVLSGDIGNIPENFSKDLYEVVLLLMKVNSNKRPTCNDILNNVHVKKRIEFLNTINNKGNDQDNGIIDEKVEQALLKTIRIPKNLLFLGNQLPKPNYEKIKKKIELKTKTTNHHNITMKTKLPKLNLNSKRNDESKNSLSIICTATKHNSIENENDENNNNLDIFNINNQNNNNIYSINNSQLEIKNDVQLYKKLYAINKNLIMPVKKNRSLDKDIPCDYNNNSTNKNIFYNNIKHNINNKIRNKYSKLYKLYEPYPQVNEVKKMPKFKILNGLRGNNKYNIFLKNREELYKDIYKNIGIKREFMQLLNKEKVNLNNSDGNNRDISQIKIDEEYKIHKIKNKLSPIIYKRESI